MELRGSIRSKGTSALARILLLPLAKLGPVLAEAFCRAAVNVVVGGQQVHDRVIGVGIPTAVVLPCDL